MVGANMNEASQRHIVRQILGYEYARVIESIAQYHKTNIFEALRRLVNESHEFQSEIGVSRG